MIIHLIRKEFTPEATLGELWVDGGFLCFTLEDKDRGLMQWDSIVTIKAKKIFGTTCIPYGKYRVKLSMSERFKRTLPEIMDVKGFAGVRIHRGNTAADTLGCIILGYKKAYNTVFESTKAELKLVQLMMGEQDIELEITK